MNKELFISSTPHETKVAVVEDDQLAEIYFERENEYTLAGSIYKGRVTRVLPGMQSAFVDVGLERDAFLYVTDFMEEQEEAEEFDQITVAPAPPQRSDQQPERAPMQVVPPAVAQVEPAAPEDEEEDSADAMAAEPGAETEEGTGDDGARRWRGRRRRGRGGRRGGRGVEQPRPAEARSSDIRTDTRSEFRPEPSRPQREENAAPSQTSAYRGRERQDYGPPPGYQPIILPGESISKYQRQTPPPARPAHAVPEVRQQEAAGERADIPAAAVAPQVFEGGYESGHEGGYEPSSSSGHITAMPGETLRSRQLRFDVAAASTGAPFAAESGAEEASAHNQANVEAEAELRYDQMNVASVFGGVEAEHEQKQSSEEVASAAGDHSVSDQPESHPEFSAEASAPLEVAEHGAPGGTVFAPGEGNIEEEEIEEEEADLAAHGEAFDDAGEFEEFEEETLDRVAESAGAIPAPELTEAVKEAAVETRAEQGYEAADTEPSEEAAEGVEGEEGDEADEFPTPLAQAGISQEEAEAYAEAIERGEEPPARAELRAPAGTAPMQQRAERPRFDRRRGRGGRRGGRSGPPPGRREQHRPQLITELLKEGQEILVQIAKEPIGKKGARITSHIALPGRFLVYMPTVNHIGVSRKISSDEERQRLKRIVVSERENGHGGFIVRTAADHAPEEDLRADIRFLKNLWHEIKSRAESGKAPALIYHDLNLVERILRDQVNENFSHIWVDTEQDYERMIRFVNRFQPSMVKRVKLYSKETPLFEQFNITEEINKALKSKVWLKSGGYIVINQTEALVAIDVNTGKYVGKTARLEDTIVKTNVDAIKEIVRQIRLRDLGGIIVIDFIDMDERRNRQKVMQALEEALKGDRAPSKVLQFNDFGLVAITRKRVKQSLERTLGTPCNYCTGTGYTKAVSTVCNEIWVEMRKMAKHFDHPDVLLRVNPEVAKALKDKGGRWIQEIEELIGRNLIVKTDPLLHQEQFDIN
jgi:Rne/Rng family ribonuclease